jgi:hypothetical protein
MYTALPLPVPSSHAFHDRIYAGDILRFDGIPALTELVSFTRAFLEDRFFPHAPPQIHEHLSHEAQVETFSACARAFGQLAEVKRLWQSVFQSVGLDPMAIARDRLRLRFQPHQPPGQLIPRALSTATIAFHRDTWGTNLYAQTNWWTPIYPISVGRTMALYPTLWSRAVRNSSADFDLAEVIERRRTDGRNSITSDEAIPYPLEEVPPALGVPVVIDPGTVIAFSGAHAHAGVGNETGLTRISLETRTISIEDFRTGKGAPNLDGRAPWMAPGLFRRVADGTKLDELVGMRGLESYTPSA